MAQWLKTHRRRLAPVALIVTAIALMLAGSFGSVSRSVAQGTPVPIEQRRTLTVSGEGRVNVTPDAARVSVGVQIVDVSLTDAQDQANTIIEAILASATAAGIADDDIQTANYNVYVIQDYDDMGNLVGVDGYQVSNQINLTVRDIDSLGQLLDETVRAGANTINGISFFVSDPSSAASQARQAAVEDAQAKADELATALGVEITGVVTVVETSAPAPMAQERGFEMAEADSAGSSVPIAAGSTEIVVRIQVTFEIG